MMLVHFLGYVRPQYVSWMFYDTVTYVPASLCLALAVT
jgi:hypothetical protein